MTWILLTPALLPLAATSLLAARRFWVMHVRPDSIQGSDLHMLKYCMEETPRARGSTYFGLRDGVDFEAAAAEILDNVRRELRAPANDSQRGLDLQARRFVRRPERTAEEIIDFVHDDAQFFSVKDDARNRELVIRCYPERRLFALLFDHSVWDGMRFMNEIVVPTVRARPFGSRWLLGDRYVPLLAELMQLWTLAALAVRWIGYRPLATHAMRIRSSSATASRWRRCATRSDATASSSRRHCWGSGCSASSRPWTPVTTGYVSA